MNRPEPPNDASQLDEFAKKLLAIDEALERNPMSDGETPRNTADATAVGDAQAQSYDETSDLLAGQCLQWIEAIRVTAPEMLDDAFQADADHVTMHAVSDQAELPDADFDSEPARIGRFEIVRRLGQGGYGVVFLAHDPTLHRDVALKVPRPEVLVTADSRRRFLREAEAAAALDHRNIVSVYEAGTAGPISYIASAYCPGLSLTQWLQERGQVMSPRLAAEIIAALASAVQHAHERGVLHRDIKPGNVLIEELDQITDETLAGSVRLADFGLARVIADSSDDSISMGIVGTPAYMSPEQAANRREDIGPSTDVYGLGATLYHLLTGRPPIIGSSQIETLSAILTEEPVEPSQYRSDVPRDLSAICAKSLEKDIPRRYPTAAAMEQDLRRFLRGEQVVARPVSQLQRAGKWCKRNPVVATLAATSVVAVLTTLAVAVGGWWSTSRALERESLALVEADRAYHETKQAIDEYCVTVSENQLLNAPGMTPLRKELLVGALDYYTRFVERHAHDDDAVDELRKAHVRIADVHESLGDYAAAQSAYQQALLLLDRPAGDDQAQQTQHRQGMIHRKLAHLCRRLNQPAAALEHAERSLELHRRLLDQEFMLRRSRHQLAQALGAKASVLQRTGQHQEAIELYEEGELLVERLLQDTSGGVATAVADDKENEGAAAEPELRLRLAQLRGNRSIALRVMGKLDESKFLLESAAQVYEQLVEDHPEVAEYQENLGKAYANLSLYDSMSSDLDASLLHLSEATKIFDALATAYPRVNRYEMLRATTRKEAATIWLSLGQSQRAEVLLVETIDIFEKVQNTTPEAISVDLADTRLALGRALLSRREAGRALPLVEVALAALEKQRNSTPRDYHTCLALALAYEQRAALCSADGQLDESLSWLDKGVEVIEALQQVIPGGTHIGTFLAANHAHRADVFEHQEDFSQALHYRRLALDAGPAEAQAGHQAKLAATLALAGDVAEASTLVSEAAPQPSRELLPWLFVIRAHAIVAASYKPTDSEESEFHRQRALELLREAMQSGVLDDSSSRMLADDYYSSVRGLDGFEEMVDWPRQSSANGIGAEAVE